MKTVTVFVLTLSGVLTSASAVANILSYAQGGLRIGTDAERRVDLISYEAFGTIESTWSWELSDRLVMAIDFETALGGLSGEGETAVYARVAPVLVFGISDFPVSLNISSGPSLYSEGTFGDYDLGGNFHFTSSIGLTFDFEDAWAVGYRFQHTSNAGLGDPNPGLDMHTISIAYTF